MRDQAIPAFWLYGDRRDDRFPDALHIETLELRSAAYNWRIQPHRHHDMFQFMLVEKGGGETRVDGRAFPLRSGTAVLLPPLTVHEFKFRAGSDGFVASAARTTMLRLLKDEPAAAAILSQPAVAAIARNDPALRDLGAVMRAALAEFAGGRANRDFALSAYAELIAIWFARAVRRHVANDDPAPPPRADLVRRFIELVEASFRAHKPLTDYAKALGVSTTHLTRTCRQVVGRSATQIMQERVMIEARRDLVYTALPISQIAFQLGFSDPAYFSRFFTAHAGTSPKTYRMSG